MGSSRQAAPDVRAHLLFQNQCKLQGEQQKTTWDPTCQSMTICPYQQPLVALSLFPREAVGSEMGTPFSLFGQRGFPGVLLTARSMREMKLVDKFYSRFHTTTYAIGQFSMLTESKSQLDIGGRC